MSKHVCPICGNEVKIEKIGTSAGMEGRYYDWVITCDNCKLLHVEYSADNFYNSSYCKTEEEALAKFDEMCRKAKNGVKKTEKVKNNVKTTEPDPRIYNDRPTGNPILEDEAYGGYHYRIVRIRGDHPCCYIEITEGHPWYHQPYQRLQWDFDWDDEGKLVERPPIGGKTINVHGGITYSDDMSVRDEWWIGWDYAHAGDYCHHSMQHLPSDHVWTMDELRREVYNAIDQLNDIFKEDDKA